MAKRACMLLAGCVCLSVAHSVELALSTGAYWEYLWTTQSIDVVQGSPTDVDIATGRFTITLGVPVLIEGKEAFPLDVQGNTSDGTFDYAPRWTHLSTSDGSLLGSTDGVTLQTVVSAVPELGSLGFFADFPATTELTSVLTTFDGNYNDFPGFSVRRDESAGGCVVYSFLPDPVCPNDDPQVSVDEIDYFKDGFGSVGARLYVNVTSDGGGFFTSFTDDRVIELIDTSLAASDGFRITPPPWEPMPGMLFARYGHGSAVFNDRLYVAGGIGGDHSALGSTEVFLLGGSRWVSGPQLQSPSSTVKLEVVAGALYALIPGQPLLRLSDTGEHWQEAGVSNPSFIDTCVIDNRYIMAIQSDSSGLISSTRLIPHFYDVQLGAWQEGISAITTRILRFAIGCLGSEVLVSGGYRFGTLSTDPGITDAVLSYEAINGDWAFTSPMTVKRESHASVELHGQVVVLGGRLGSAIREVELMPYSMGRWRDVLPMLQPRESLGAAAAAGRIYVTGGIRDGEVLGSAAMFIAPPLIFRDGFEP